MKAPSQLAESKLIILYMLYKMNLPVSLSYIQEFALQAEYMDYFSLTAYLAELTQNEYILKNIENNKTTYIISDKGCKILSFFENLIPSYIKTQINEYVDLRKKNVKKDLQIISNFSKNDASEYIVKCGVYENKSLVMELSLNVASKEYAKIICDNWQENVNDYYPFFLKTLLKPLNK